MADNIVKFFVDVNKVQSEKQLRSIVLELNSSYEKIKEAETNNEYYQFTIRRPNHLSMHNYTAMKIELNDIDATIDDYVNWIKNLVDTIV